MPIVSDSVGSAKYHPSLNGDLDHSLLDIDDEESFVVLERSTANNEGINSESIAQPFSVIQNDFAFPPVFNNLVSSGMAASQPQVIQTTPIEPLGLHFDGPHSSVSAEDIEKRLQDVLLENENLKKTVHQNNLAIKQQLKTVSLLQDRALEGQKNQQAKFEETKMLILKLGSEKTELQETNNLISAELDKIKEENKQLKETNESLECNTLRINNDVKELKDSNIALGTEASKLLLENETLKKQLAATQESLQIAFENGRKITSQQSTKEIELHELVDELTKKLEGVERARRQQEFDIERLQAQLGRATGELTEAQRKLAHSTDALQAAQSQTNVENSTLQYGEKLSKYTILLQQLKESVVEEQGRLNSLSSWLTLTEPGNGAQYEISELRRLLSEEQAQSVSRKNNLFHSLALIHDMLVDFRNVVEEFEKVKADYAVKQSHSFTYDELQKKGFRERLDSLTAKLVEKEEALAISERHLASLQEAVTLQNAEKENNEKLEVLKEQVKALTGEVGAKQEELKSNTQEIKTLKSEVQKLQAAKDTILALEEQAKIFQADFEAERKARESIVEEKERLLEDFRHLQRRNQDLIEEINGFRIKQREHVQAEPPRENAQPAQFMRGSFSSSRSQRQTPTPPPPKPQKNPITPQTNQRQFVCPNSNCNLPFNTLDEVHLHVVACWGLQD